MADGAGTGIGDVPVQFTRESILEDYRIACRSREASLLGRKEVLTGKAKFGIFGDGKEVAQVALARAFRAGDFRAGYYRDQTLMLALGVLTVEQLFAQLYADTDPDREPCSGGRQMNAHFATRLIDEEGNWVSHVDRFNSAADLSPTGSQMPKLVGLAYASRLYRELPGLEDFGSFSRRGSEIAFGTIGNASCAEGLFWESLNAAGVLRVPLLLSIWDDGYGISVSNDEQVTKGEISELLRGFQRSPGSRDGIDLYSVRGWDYSGLCKTYLDAADIVRREHVPAVVHVREMTQPQGHSTSGSHERYKSASRLEWEREFDCLVRMRAWIESRGLADARSLDELEEEERNLVRDQQRRAWGAFRAPFEADRKALVSVLGDLAAVSDEGGRLGARLERLEGMPQPLRRDLMMVADEALVLTRSEQAPERRHLQEWRRRQLIESRARFGSDLYSESSTSALDIPQRHPEYGAPERRVSGFEVLNACFDSLLESYPNLVAFGEDVGRLGDVNQGMAGLQEKFGPLRVSDTGIREATILGQAIGLAMRGFRPICEIQYLDYVLYALQILSDDLATLRWRSAGRQKAPVIIRTRGHRLEGVWHSGSPMAALVSLGRGVHVCVPRDMTRAAGFYNGLLRSDDPAIVVEVLNGYRLKERLPSNLGELTVPLGVIEILRPGEDVTVVTYGPCCRIALDAAARLETVGIDVEVVDVQTLLPFDRHCRIRHSIEKTNRVVFLDEDVPGGGTAYMMQQVLDGQGAYEWLDSEPIAVSAKEHRPAYGSDGDYFSKPNREDVFASVYELMHRSDPVAFPVIF
jgi:pyruvate/2-oxoglutarate/acetoin dehydrogenase E1 component/TPP-dependent pyruvate/acetoin dehydrogenase alpha subunit